MNPTLPPLPNLALVSCCGGGDCIEGAPDDYAVTYAAYDSDTGWAVEIARPSHLKDDVAAPHPADLPDDVRTALLAWLQAV